MRKRLFAIMTAVIIFVIAGSFSSMAASGYTRPGNVTGFKSVHSYKSVVLTWNKVKNADGYLIVWAGDGKGRHHIRVDRGTTTWYRHAIPEGVNYTYLIYAVRTNTKGRYATGDAWRAQSATPAKTTGEAVRLMRNQIVFGEGKTLYSHTGGSVAHYFPYGYKTLTTGYDNGGYEFWYGGRQYRVSRIRISRASVYYLKPSYTYSRAVAESFVNTAKIKSSTSKLVWVNQYTQKLYVFQNVSGIWHCIRGPWDVSSGAPESPTDTGLTRIKQKDSYHNNLPYWSVCSVFSLHGKYSYWELGWPRSNGCCRNYNGNAEYIYDNCPIGTAVLIW